MKFLPVWLVAVAVSVAAEEWVPTPEGGDPMLLADSLRVIGSSAISEAVDVEGMPFRRAFRVAVAGVPRNAWDVQILGNTTGDVRQGDVLWFSLFARGTSQTESGEAAGTAYLQRSSGDNAKLAGMPFAVGPEWRQFMMPARASITLPNGQHNFTIFLGYPNQTIEIGGVTLVNYRDTRGVNDLPRTKITWPGSEPDAPWRSEAAARIDRIRKADLRVHVVDPAGQPVRGAQVHVTMRRHEFGFGSAVAADGIFSQAPDSHAYREVIRTWFNKVVLENDLKWPSWESNRKRALDALAWLRENGITQVRGHTLVWPGWSRMPADVQRMANDPERLRARVLDHIGEELDATRGQLVEWDVINEPYTNTDLQKILGDEEMAAWFRKARAHEPDALLYINDYSILTGGGMDVAHQNHYFETIGKLIAWGAQLDGIGMQGHFGAQMTAPTKLWQIIDRFGVYGKRIHVTEFDIDIDDEEAQAAYTRDFLTAIFAHPSVDGFMMWGFWESRHWRPRAAMFRRDWSIKPNGYAFHDLVHREWTTDARGLTAADGAFQVRGFKGEYDVEVTSGTRTSVAGARLTGDGSAVTVTLR